MSSSHSFLVLLSSAHIMYSVPDEPQVTRNLCLFSPFSSKTSVCVLSFIARIPCKEREGEREKERERERRREKERGGD